MFKLALQSLRFYWRTHLGVLLGTLLASAVLTGAMLVGDSVDYSLRTFALQRLGDVDYAVNTRNQYVHQDLATRLGETVDGRITPLLQLRGMAIRQGARSDDRAQVNTVEVYGVDESFWRLGDGQPFALAPTETAINRRLATALGVSEGDEIALRVAKPSLMARDSPLSWRNEERTRRGLYTVKRIVSDEEMGRFSLNPSQIPPHNAFVDRTDLQQRIDLPSRINLILVDTESDLELVQAALERAWNPSHIGLEFTYHEGGVIQLESERIFLSPESARAALELPNAQGTLTYLGNTLRKGERITPYFFAVAGPVPDDMADDEIVLNRWVADAIGAEVGDTITMTYAELQPSNDFENRSREFTVHSIREMENLETERELTPIFPGLTDVESCADWDVGMPMDDELLNDDANEAYWDEYRQTPKALVTLAAGQEMWGNRFGNVTAVRYAGGEDDIPALRASLQQSIDPALTGLVFVPARTHALAAVDGAMDFGGLFIGMSFFLIVAALMLTGLLFVFGVQQRAAEMGTLMAVGFSPRDVRKLHLAEGFVIALLGAAGGAVLSTFYTRALIFGLANYWQGAVANATILYHATTTTLILGAVISLFCALGAMAIAMWRQTKHPARELLTMDFSQETPGSKAKSAGKLGLILSIGGIVAALAIIAYGFLAASGDVMVPFFAAGSLLLLSGIGLSRQGLIAVDRRHSEARFTLARMSLQNVARRRGRSLSVVGLLASGCFLVFAVASMQQDLYANADERSSGTGGFELLAESTFPILEDTIEELDEEGVSGAAVKVRDGDDASCLNLNQAQTPRVMGVTVEDFISRKAFENPSRDESLWRLLEDERADGAIPALVGDTNTALFTLKKKADPETGDVLVYQDESGEEVNVKLVGALPMRLSIFSGTIVMSDANFTRLFPSEDGHRMFLVDAPEGGTDEIASTLQRRYDRYGMNVVPPVERLLDFYAVETTYLAMFLVLGGLGLAIGSIGMGVVVLRNLLERRAEVAMLEALGFERTPLYKVLFTEYGVLLVAGLGVGIISAGISTMPALFATSSRVQVGLQVELAVLVTVVCVVCMGAAVMVGARRVGFEALRNE